MMEASQLVVVVVEVLLRYMWGCGVNVRERWGGGRLIGEGRHPIAAGIVLALKQGRHTKSIRGQ